MSKYIHGGHIRGRLYWHRELSPLAGWFTYYGMSVLNTRTGATIAHDNGYKTLEEAATTCAEVVQSARNAWSYGFGSKVTR